MHTWVIMISNSVVKKIQNLMSHTATTLIYAIGAGITAAAGTRLASNCSSLRDLNCSHSNCQTEKAQHCYLLSLPPRVGANTLPSEVDRAET